MKSNLKLSMIQDKLTYLQTILKQEGRFLEPQGMKLLNIQLSEVKAQLKEAKARNVVGVTKDKGLAVYLAESVIGDEDVQLLYIESLPTGWDAGQFDMTKGNEVVVCVDASQEWNETIVFDFTVA
tara:strand:- start:12904 stop:13278 length:375 start_codon:yes stop_codon:yes gene_type:complete